MCVEAPGTFPHTVSCSRVPGMVYLAMQFTRTLHLSFTLAGTDLAGEHTYGTSSGARSLTHSAAAALLRRRCLASTHTVAVSVPSTAARGCCSSTVRSSATSYGPAGHANSLSQADVWFAHE